MTLMNIRLELARTPEFPDGSRTHGYEFTAPVTKDGHLDAAAWAKNKERRTVTRFWDGREIKGKLRHVGSGWRFDYIEGDDDDEPFFKLDKHHIEPGLYVTIREADGKEQPFKIVSVEPAAPK
ncbi:MAG TPA: hypothetical protein VGT78_00820 [Rhizomicrobium sp.]|nr:hypothetical protein [Rhizomicrobium sp.]